MRLARIGILALSINLVCSPFGVTNEPAGDTAAELVAHERLRAAVEDAFGAYVSPSPDRALDPDLMIESSDRLVALGPDVLPFLEFELKSDETRAYFLAVFTLGRMPGEAAAALLRGAAEARAGRADERFVKERMWACYGLALQGRVEAIERLASGDPFAGMVDFFRDTSALRVATYVLGDAAVPTLLDLRARFDTASPADRLRLLYVVNALAPVASAENLPAVRPLLDHKEWRIRREAAGVLGHVDVPASLDLLFERLAADPDARVRASIAAAIEGLRPTDRFEAILAALEVQTDSYVRGCLYRVLAASGDPRALEGLRAHWGRADDLDRTWLVDAVGTLPGNGGLNLLREAVRDRSVEVAVHAAMALARNGSPGAIETLLALVNDPAWPIAETAITRLGDLGARRAAPRIADALIERELKQAATSVATRTRARVMGSALVALDFSTPAEDIRRLVARQGDPDLKTELAHLAGLLSAIAANGDDVGAWSVAATSDDGDLREVAYRRLARIGRKEAVEALVARFADASVPDRVSIVERLGAVRSEGAAPLLEAALLDPEFDTPENRPVRSAAAWAAKEIGGRAMLDLLDRSVERRGGRDPYVVTYLAAARGAAGAELIRRLRPVRFGLPSMERGVEQEELDRLARDLAAGRAVDRLDRPPDDLHRH